MYSSIAAINFSIGKLRLIRIIDVRTSLLGACNEIAKFTCSPLSANSRIFGTKPLVETVIWRAPIAKPLSSLIVRKKFMTLA